MAVLQVATGARCKLCQHPRRNDIDKLLEQRSRRQKDADGQQINREYVLARLAEWGVENPTTENVSNHVKKHLSFVDDTVQAQAMEAVQQKMAEALERRGTDFDSVEGKLRWIVDVGIGEIEERLMRGEKSGVTLDHVMKAAAELSRRSHSESQRELLGALVGGIGHALGGGKPQAALPEPAIDAEYEEVQA